MKHQQRLPRLIMSLIMLSGLLASNGLQPIPTAQAADTITGNVFRDINANGIDDGAGEIGVAGVTVTAYDAAGVNRGTASTLAIGNYTLNATGTGPYRIEFTTLPTRGLCTWPPWHRLGHNRAVCAGWQFEQRQPGCSLARTTT